MAEALAGSEREGEQVDLALGAGVHDFFAGIDPELLPYHDGRGKLIPAERLFGFVSATGSNDKSKDTKHTAYAGRVRFSMARLEQPDATDNDLFGADADDRTPLKVLASPKPPSPSLYFRNKNGSSGAIERRKLALDAHEPQGRKVYLHRPHTGDGPQAQPWRTQVPTENKKQKNAVKPLKPGVSFAFHLDFDNVRRTGNLRAVQLLLGHQKIESTVRYLGVEVDDALEIAEKTDV